jgi:hypothetical protein
MKIKMEIKRLLFIILMEKNFQENKSQMPIIKTKFLIVALERMDESRRQEVKNIFNVNKKCRLILFNV